MRDMSVSPFIRDRSAYSFPLLEPVGRTCKFRFCSDRRKRRPTNHHHFIGFFLGSDWELADDVVLFVSCLNNADDGELLLCDGGMSGLPTVVPLSVGDCWVSLSSLGIVTPPRRPSSPNQYFSSLSFRFPRLRKVYLRTSVYLRRTNGRFFF